MSLGPHRSVTAVLSCGVPQGSILGPLEIASHMNFGSSYSAHNKDLCCHCYADDIQLYVSFRTDKLKQQLADGC